METGLQTFKGVDVLVLEVDSHGGFVWIEVEKLQKRACDIILGELSEKRMSQYYREHPKIKKEWKDLLDWVF